MRTPRSGLVEIAREFLLAYRRTREVASLYRAGELSFEVVRGWVGDDDESALFRLKERCHAWFRTASATDGEAGREALFDLTVGALFHEAMRFRENFYQREVYGPRIRVLRGTSVEEVELFGEFERILAGASVRLDEALQETEALLDQTRRQFRALLTARNGDGLVTRYLIERAGHVAVVFEDGLDALLADVHGDAATARALAARSYLDSGHFREAVPLLDAALAADRTREAWRRLRDYAAGMAAYLAGDYGRTVASLGAWLDRGPGPDEAAFLALALDAMGHVGQLAQGEDRNAVSADAESLVKRLQTLVEPA